jgi:hypothetical protein
MHFHHYDSSLWRSLVNCKLFNIRTNVKVKKTVLFSSSLGSISINRANNRKLYLIPLRKSRPPLTGSWNLKLGIPNRGPWCEGRPRTRP